MDSRRAIAAACRCILVGVVLTILLLYAIISVALRRHEGIFKGFDPNFPNHFATLGIPWDASMRKVVWAKREAARLCHPDKLPRDLSPKKRVRAAEHYQRMMDAAEVLLDESARESYLMKYWYDGVVWNKTFQTHKALWTLEKTCRSSPRRIRFLRFDADINEVVVVGAVYFGAGLIFGLCWLAWKHSRRTFSSPEAATPSPAVPVSVPPTAPITLSQLRPERLEPERRVTRNQSKRTAQKFPPGTNAPISTSPDDSHVPVQSPAADPNASLQTSIDYSNLPAKSSVADLIRRSVAELKRRRAAETDTDNSSHDGGGSSQDNSSADHSGSDIGSDIAHADNSTSSPSFLRSTSSLLFVLLLLVWPPFFLYYNLLHGDQMRRYEELHREFMELSDSATILWGMLSELQSNMSMLAHRVRELEQRRGWRGW